MSYAVGLEPPDTFPFNHVCMDCGWPCDGQVCPQCEDVWGGDYGD